MIYAALAFLAATASGETWRDVPHGYTSGKIELNDGQVGQFNFDYSYANNPMTASSSVPSGADVFVSLNIHLNGATGSGNVYASSSTLSPSSWSTSTWSNNYIGDVDSSGDFWWYGPVSQAPPSLAVWGSCEIGDGCLTTANFNAQYYFYYDGSSQSSTTWGPMDTPWPVAHYRDPVDDKEINGLSNEEFAGQGNFFGSWRWGLSTHLSRNAQQGGLDLFFELEPTLLSLGSSYAICFSTWNPIIASGGLDAWTTSSAPPVDYNNVTCNLGCYPNSDCSTSGGAIAAGYLQEKIGVAVEADDFFATTYIIDEVVWSEHYMAWAWGHYPSSAMTVAPAAAALVAAALF
jgi:hypothetical protein